MARSSIIRRREWKTPAIPESAARRRLGGEPEAIPRQVHGFNQGANSFQIDPNKTKQKYLDLLGFIRPNRGFSMGYGESK
jgi:hypothetical protein